MTKYNLWLDGVSAEDVGIRFLSALELDAPVPRVTEYSVPGRNGDVHIFDGSFKNRGAAVEGCLYSADLVKEGFGALNEWLFGTLGYRRLVTDDDPEHYLMARITNGAEVAAKARKVAPFRIRFDCKPQRFLVSGDEPMIFEDGAETSFYSPALFPTKPLLKIWHTTTSLTKGNIYINDVTATLDTLKVANYEYIYYDAEIENAYTDTRSFDAIVRSGSGISLVPGKNTIAFDGDITKIEITPRWWEL